MSPEELIQQISATWEDSSGGAVDLFSEERLGWAPSISLRDGMERTYAWIYEAMKSGGGASSIYNELR